MSKLILGIETSSNICSVSLFNKSEIIGVIEELIDRKHAEILPDYIEILLKNNKKKFKGIANLGYRPTFNQKKILLEVHIFNFNRNIYNKHLTIEFINFIRKEKKFKNINQLKKQINLDLKIAKKIK